MTDELTRELLVPSNTHRRRTMLIAIASGFAGIALGLATGFTRVTTVNKPAHVTTQVMHVQIPVPVMIQMPPSSRMSELSMVISIKGTSYAQIGSGDEIKHGKLQLVEDDGVEIAIANVSERDLPAAYQSWKQRMVLVDGTCEAKVKGFAVVSRVTGSPGFLDNGDETWTVKNVWDHAATMLVARLDDCKGTWARDAKLPPVSIPQEIEDHEDLAEQARALVFASPQAKEAQRLWREGDGKGTWYGADDATITTHVVRHPQTGTLWVWVHAYNDERCGDPGGNVFGLFRVDGKKLVTVQLRTTELTSVDQVIDIERDGELELVGTEWIGTDKTVERATGEDVATSSVAFFGCGC
jgi:hypothetical protein